jgi:hypothetical protein
LVYNLAFALLKSRLRNANFPSVVPLAHVIKSFLLEQLYNEQLVMSLSQKAVKKKNFSTNVLVHHCQLLHTLLPEKSKNVARSIIPLTV